MRPFEYIRCSTAAEACAAQAAYAGRSRILAGGTDLLVELRRSGSNFPAAVVDISGIASLRGISERDGEFSIGPLTTHAELFRSPLLRRGAPFLSVAAGRVGSPQIRNRGTIGGNIMNAAACADTLPPLIALGARLTLRSLRGERVVDADAFFEGPYRTRARADELLTGITFPSLRAGAKTAFVKLGRRNAVTIARISVAALVARSEEGAITEARIVPGAVLPVWKRILRAEATLVGRFPSHDLFDAAGAMASEAMIEETGRRWSSEYKEPVLRVLVRRALEECCGEGGGPK